MSGVACIRCSTGKGEFCRHCVEMLEELARIEQMLEKTSAVDNLIIWAKRGGAPENLIERLMASQRKS